MSAFVNNVLSAPWLQTFELNYHKKRKHYIYIILHIVTYQHLPFPVEIVCSISPFFYLLLSILLDTTSPSPQAIPSYLNYSRALLSASLTLSSLDLIYFKYSFNAFSSINSTFLMLLLYLKTFYGLWVLTTSQLSSFPWSCVGTWFSTCFC